MCPMPQARPTLAQTKSRQIAMAWRFAETLPHKPRLAPACPRMPAASALLDLGIPKGDHPLWLGIITAFFLVGAATGGVLFGWLGDRIGRVKAMIFSVLTYAVFSGACGLVDTAWQIGVFRFLAALGMGGEWSLGVALINEIWPGRSRGFLAGLIGAAANVGYLTIALVGGIVINNISPVRGVLDGLGLSDAWVDYLVT